MTYVSKTVRCLSEKTTFYWVGMIFRLGDGIPMNVPILAGIDFSFVRFSSLLYLPGANFPRGSPVAPPVCIMR